MKPLRSLFPYFIRYKNLLGFGILFIVLTNFFRILSPSITGLVIQSILHRNVQAVTPRHVSFLPQDLIQWFIALPSSYQALIGGAMLFALALLSGLFMFFMRQTIIVMSRKIEFDQKNDIYQHYQKLDWLFFKQLSVGDLMNRITEDVSRVRMYTGPSLMYLINLVVLITLCLFFMWNSSPYLTLISLAPMPVLAFTIYRVNNLIQQRAEKVQSSLSRLTTLAQESFSGIRVIKSFLQEKNQIKTFDSESESFRMESKKLAQTEAFYFPSMALLIGLSTVMVIGMGAWQISKGNQDIQVGQLAEFVLYIQMLTFPVSAIGWTAGMIQRASVSQQRINEFLLTNPLIQDNQESSTEFSPGTIQWNNAAFTYPNSGIQALNQLDLNIQPGKKIAILGTIGCGKTTLALSLIRLIDLDEGSLTINHQPISKIKLTSLRSQIAYVPQDPFLFSDTIENNIRMGNPDASFEQIREAARLAEILDEIEQFKDGFQTKVGERGITLSGGQKQRISLARALIKPAAILILDDALSAVDLHTEHRILEHLSTYFKENTWIFITHRIITQYPLDAIYVMQSGSVLESGTHESLILQRGLYYNLAIEQGLSIH
jgi:ATP-binding cassette subfamily B protein